VAEHDSRDDNIFDQVRANANRLDELERFVKGDAWNPGLIILLREMQTKQKALELKVNLLLSVTVFLLLLSLVLSVLLAAHMGVGL
jgi:hypothetical protein